MRALELTNRWVLVTGASSGLGLEMARQLARDYRANLILTARREDALTALAGELETLGVETRVLTADLANKTELDRLIRDTLALEPYAAVLNAGVTYYGEHLNMPEDGLASLLQTNIRSTVRLTEALLPALTKRAGGLMLVTSLAGLIPLPYQAAYSGSKAFTTHFGLAVAEELKGKNVSLSVFAPGGIQTHMLERSGLAQKFKPGDASLMSAERCARLGLQAFVKRKTLAVPGLRNKLSLGLARGMPLEVLTRLMARIYRPS